MRFFQRAAIVLLASLSGVTLLLAQKGPPPPGQGGRGFGAPLPDLTRQEREEFREGLEEFRTREAVDTGLGPIFNGVSCIECHDAPGPGGSSIILVTRFGRTINGQFDPLTARGGSLLQRFAIDAGAMETIAREANVVAERQTTPLFGLGLIEAIADEDIQAYADAPKPDGVRGRAARVFDPATRTMRIGRFGWKAQHATLLGFAADAYLNEMGITNRFFPQENAPNGNLRLLAAIDRVADPEDDSDPETGKADVDRLAEFMRWLGAPPVQPPTDDARAGQEIFSAIGCATCHRPAMTTARMRSRALSSKTVALYSDLLLHDMGDLGDGIAQGDAGPREIRTPPLWGVRASAPYLHDGRASSIDEAIRAHAGEATAARDRYAALADAPRQRLLSFLGAI